MWSHVSSFTSERLLLYLSNEANAFLPKREAERIRWCSTTISRRYTQEVVFPCVYRGHSLIGSMLCFIDSLAEIFSGYIFYSFVFTFIYVYSFIYLFIPSANTKISPVGFSWRIHRIWGVKYLLGTHICEGNGRGSKSDGGKSHTNMQARWKIRADVADGAVLGYDWLKWLFLPPPSCTFTNRGLLWAEHDLRQGQAQLKQSLTELREEGCAEMALYAEEQGIFPEVAPVSCTGGCSGQTCAWIRVGWWAVQGQARKTNPLTS